MGREFLVLYKEQNRLSDDKIKEIGSKLINNSSGLYKADFLKKEDQNDVYGIKINSIPTDDDWYWDIYLYISNDNGLIVFNIGTGQDVEMFCSELSGIFKSLNIDVLIEEE